MTPAGNAAFRLHKAMINSGIDSSVLTMLPTIKRYHVYNIHPSIKTYLIRRVEKMYEALLLYNKKQNTYTYHVLPVFTLNNIEKYTKEYDIIYLHWISAGFLSEKDIEKLAKSKKIIIFFMHDMWTMTGGCHHSFDCTSYKNGCVNCPFFSMRSKIAKKEAIKKRNLFSKYSNLIFISPSEWMAECARQSFILKDKPIYSVSNIVDETIFKPINKMVAKQILNLPTDKFIITFGCQAGSANKYKGFNYLRDALNKIPLNKEAHLLIYGSDYNQQTVDELNYPISFLGPVNDEFTLSLICNASDLFVSPSLAESFGLTFLENILCETPVVGFDTTAIPELVRTGENGYLAKYKDTDDLANGIMYVFNNMKKAKGRNLYSSNDIVKKHISIINEIYNE